MKSLLLALAAGAAAAAGLSAQNNQLGFTAGWNTSYTDRVGAVSFEADVLNHYDSRSYQDWMLDPLDPTGATYTFTACTFVIQDQVGTTPETFTVVGYNEDPALPNFPDITTAWFRTGVLNTPANTTAGAIAWLFTVTLTPPPVAKGDKWIGVNLPTPAVGGNWPADGLSIHVGYESVPNWGGPALRDLMGPGKALIPNANLSCNVATASGIATGPVIYPAVDVRQLRFEILANVAGGMCVAQTNQTLFPSGAAAGNARLPLGGTTNWLSGLNPDLNNFTNSTPARADDIGFVVTESGLPFSPVFVLIALGPSPLGSLPVSTIMGPVANPATKGNVCIDFTTAASFLGFSDGTGVYQHMLTLTPAVRAAFQGLTPIDLWYQGFVLDTSATQGFKVHATGCGIQHL
jgi:hypothetical protein